MKVRSEMELSFAVLSYLAENPGATVTPIMSSSRLDCGNAHRILNKLEIEGSIKSKLLPPPSHQAKYYRKQLMSYHHKGRPKKRFIVKRTYELTEQGRQLVLAWKELLRMYQSEEKNRVSILSIFDK